MALTTALDMTEGQPAEHCVRCCWIGMHVGEQLHLSQPQLHDLFFTLLLKDAGCSSNAARICELYATDDRAFKRQYKTVGTSLSSVINFIVKNTGTGQNWVKRIATTVDILKNGSEYAHELIETRCTRGADVARELKFSEAVAAGVHGLDEHWDGTGNPAGLQGEQIPLYSRIALLAQVFDVFQFEYGVDEAIEEIRARSGHWFDPQLVATLTLVTDKHDFVAGLHSDNITEQVMNLAPAKTHLSVDDNYFNRIVTAFGKIVDSKSPFTAGHSERVAVFADLIAQELGMAAQERTWLRRAALLHDLGKLGVSNTILDKPGKLTDDEWEEVKSHAIKTEHILSKISPLMQFARLAAAHHEKLDGGGYPRGISGDNICLMTRIITTADIFDAITAERPYRAAIPIPKTLEIMQQSLGSAIDENCFSALQRAIDKLPPHYTAQLNNQSLPKSPLL